MSSTLRFNDRVHAGAFLAARLGSYARRADVLVLALPRGGVPVAYSVATALGLPLDVFMVRGLRVPGRPFALGAVARDGLRVLNETLVRTLLVPEKALDEAARREAKEIARRERLYRGRRAYPELRGRTVLLVDDGSASPATVRAATRALRRLGASRLVAALPVSSPATCRELEPAVEELVCATVAEPSRAPAEFYSEFEKPSDTEVRALLEVAARQRDAARLGDKDGPARRALRRH